MRKPVTLAFAAVLYGTPAYANDVWQFKVTEDQNGSDGSCDEPASIPCSITNRAAPYVLGTLTISAPVAVYATSQDMPIVTAFDDQHVISFVPTNLNALKWPPIAGTPLIVSISVNEVTNKLSGAMSLDLDGFDNQVLVMTGMGNSWTGYWYTRAGVIHQFRATSVKQHN